MCNIRGTRGTNLKGVLITAHLFLQCYVVEKIHCVWLVNGELQVLFECDRSTGLESAPVHSVKNKELVQEYLDRRRHIPHIQKIITMQSTEGLEVDL